ncbi:MAG: Holliday junction branch migration protein RuvA [Lachnospiraceae bacterium]|nr:Holliday junction branch migration protein RuvA [Lachnospiraceae bacterium]
MIAYIQGTVRAIRDDSLVIDRGGIGFRVFVPASVSANVREGSEECIYTHFAVREDAVCLYGFLTEDDLEVFRLLLGVSGIGPKGALGILSVMSADDLRFAVLADDAAGIAKAPGVGKKTAQKVILELRDKLSLRDAFEKKAQHTSVAAGEAGGDAGRDAVMALTALGYSGTEAHRAVRSVLQLTPEADTEALIKAALKELF